ncbi:hypothetical protein AVEN_243116-1 [Araneus ventricosus]|uniref:Uncharacterized protein n=1 Tax=Araneus ventricosus TaxID=182803 RepID=A0A4Y2VBQ7_ARAVE|nr:hypothetical protein AVEN_243116-1 [Araneus ventricosus]
MRETSLMKELEQEMEVPDIRFLSTSKSNPKPVTIELPKNPFKSPKINQLSGRLKLSLNQRTDLVASTANEGGFNINVLSLTRETVRTASEKVRTDITQNIKTNFTAPKN